MKTNKQKIEELVLKEIREFDWGIDSMFDLNWLKYWQNELRSIEDKPKKNMTKQNYLDSRTPEERANEPSFETTMTKQTTTMSERFDEELGYLNLPSENAKVLSFIRQELEAQKQELITRLKQ